MKINNFIKVLIDLFECMYTIESAEVEHYTEGKKHDYHRGRRDAFEEVCKMLAKYGVGDEQNK